MIARLLAALAVTAALGSPFASAAETAPLRIGYQRYGTLNILKIHGNLDKRLAAEGVKVEWSLFAAGPQLLEGLNVGSIDVGSTGEAPPIFAQAADVPLTYIGTEPPNPDSEAIIVPKGSPITSVAQLKGKKVALNKGSNVHFLLVKALEKAGLAYGDISVQFLKPADARSAFEKGAVDAWVIWEPFLTAAVTATSATVLTDGTGLVANREFYLANKPYAAANAKTIGILLEELQVADDWAVKDPAAVAAALAPDVGVEPKVLEVIARRQARGVHRIDAKIVADQQSIADVFLGLKLIPKAIDVKAIAPY